MSNDNYDAITGSGSTVGGRVKIPDGLIPADAKVARETKIAAGDFTHGSLRGREDRVRVQGRSLD